MKKQKTLIKTALFIFTALFMSGRALAICPLCTVAVGAGLGISRWLGISDLISATWVGALLASASLWTINWAKKFKFRWLREIIFIFFYATTIISLKASGVIGMLGNTVLGADKIIMGMAIGTATFIGSEIYYEKTRQKRGKALFPFQKVILPFALLAVMSIIFYLLGI
jgi:hypothetical protein